MGAHFGNDPYTVCPSRGCDKSERHAVVSTEASDMAVEQRQERNKLNRDAVKSINRAPRMKETSPPGGVGVWWSNW